MVTDLTTQYASVDRPEQQPGLIGGPMDAWIEYTNRFSPAMGPYQRGGHLDRALRLLGNRAPPQEHRYRWVMCFPYIEEAHDYHWVAQFKRRGGGLWFIEQAGQGGPLLVWDDVEEMQRAIYARTNSEGQHYYVRGSAFWFKCRIPDNVV